MNGNSSTQAVICVANDGNEVSLQLWKIYKPLRDDDAREEGLLRVVDESGEDYLYPESYFVAVALPKEAEQALARRVSARSPNSPLRRTAASRRR